MEEELKGEYCSLNPCSPAKDTVAATKKRKAAAKKERKARRSKQAPAAGTSKSSARIVTRLLKTA